MSQRIRVDLQTGAISVALDALDTTITFGQVPDFPTLGPDEFVAITLVDFADVSLSEIVHLTAYTAGDFTGTIARAQEGPAPARAWAAGTRWDSAPTAEEIDGLEAIILANADAHQLTFNIDGGGAVLTAGQKLGAVVRVPAAITLDAVTLIADQNGDVTVDVLRSTLAGFPTGVSLIGAGTKPSLSSARTSEDTNLADWTDTTLDAGDCVWVELSGVATITTLTVAIKGTVA